MTTHEIEKLHMAVMIANTKDQKTVSLNALAWKLFQLSRYDEAKEVAQEAFTLTNTTENIFQRASSLNIIGLVHQKQASYIYAIEYFTQSIKLYEILDDKANIASVTGNIGMVYNNLGNYLLSLEYYNKALAIHESQNTKIGIVTCTGGIGNVYLRLGDYTKAIDCFIRLRILCGEIDDDIGVATAICNIGAVYHELKDFRMSLEYHQMALEMYRELDVREGIARQIGNIGILYSEPGFDRYNPKIAEEYLLHALELNSALGRKRTLYDNHKYLFELYEQENDLPKALSQYKKFHELYVEIQNEEVKKQVDRYGWERKIAEMEKEKAITQITVESEKKLLAQKIEHQTKEVESTIRELVGKNRLLSEIRTNVQRLERYTKGEGIDILEKLSERLDRNITSLEEKSEIETQWREIHAEFTENLHHQHSDLTTMELKICVLLRMKLTTSNICSVLFLSKRTVESHRLSIRKKLRLSKQDDLNVVLSKL